MRSNKEIVAYFYDRVFNHWDLSEIDDLMQPDYIQHSPGVADGREGFKAFIKGFVTKHPHATIHALLEDGDMVCVFFKCEQDGGAIVKVFDLYRLKDGKLAEHWDCTMLTNGMPTAHTNGQF